MRKTSIIPLVLCAAHLVSIRAAADDTYACRLPGTTGTKTCTTPLQPGLGGLGHPADTTTPSDGQALVWSAGAGKYVPSAVTGLTLSTTAPANVNTTAAAVGTGTTAARADHVHLLPTGIPLANIGNGDTTATELSYVHGVTSAIQNQLAGLQPLNANLTALAALNSTGILARTGTSAWALRSITAGAGLSVVNGDGVAGSPTIAMLNTSITLSASSGLSLSGCAPVSLGGTCTINLGTELAGLASLGTTGFVSRTGAGTYTPRSITSGTGISVSNGDGVAGAPTIAIDSTVATLTGSQILTNKTINCANNTCTVRLGNDVTGTLPVANGGTNSSTALTGNQPLVSSAGKIVEAGNCGSGTLLAGGTPPGCSASPTLTTSLTVPLVTSAADLTLNAPTGQNVISTINGVQLFAVTAASVNTIIPLNMGGARILNVGTPTTSGDALAYPWITSTNDSVALSGNFNITGSSGVYQDTGLFLSPPSAGTYEGWCDVRSTIQISAGIGANLTLKMYNATAGADVAKTVRLAGQPGALNQAVVSTTPIQWIMTLSGASTIRLYAARNGSATYSISVVEGNGSDYTVCGYTRIN